MTDARSHISDSRSHVSGTRGNEVKSAVSGAADARSHVSSARGADAKSGVSGAGDGDDRRSRSSAGGRDKTSGGGGGGKGGDEKKKSLLGKDDPKAAVEKEPVVREFQVLDPNPAAAANTKSQFASNAISTAKYSFFFFMPDFIVWRNLWEQFHRYANLYFLLISFLQLIPGLSPTGRFTTLVPLIIVLSVTMVKDFVEDVQRHNSDRELNGKTTRAWRNGNWATIEWKDLRVGEVCLVNKNEIFPADLILVWSSLSEGMGYIETSSLDGETNLKIRKAPSALYKQFQPADPSSVQGKVVCETPNERLYNFEGYYQGKGRPDKVPITADNFLLRGAELRNTPDAIGIVVFTGGDTKLMRNSSAKASKMSRVDHVTNKQIMYVFAVLLVLCFGSTVGAVIFRSRVKKSWYLASGVKTSVVESNMALFAVSSFGTFLILFNNLIPISLYVSLEMVKVVIASVINNDLNMYHDESDTPALTRTSSLVEELGQIEYIFSDKTGTLTCNMMDFLKFTVTHVDPFTRKLSVHAYGTGTTEIGRAAAIREGREMNDDRPPGWSPGPEGFQFYDRRINDFQWCKQQNAEDLEFFLVFLGVCHDVIPEIDQETGAIAYQAASPDESCLAKDDMELLTDTGFVDYAEAKRRFNAGTLTVAGYNQSTRFLVYEKPTRFIDNEGAPADGMYEIKERVIAGQGKNGADTSCGFSAKVTGDHELLMESSPQVPWGEQNSASCLEGLGPVKPTVKQVLGQTLMSNGKKWPAGMKTNQPGARPRKPLSDTGRLYHTPAAVNGLDGGESIRHLIPIADLAPAWTGARDDEAAAAARLAGKRHGREPDVTKEQIERDVCELLGFWLGDGSFDAQSANGCAVLFSQVKQSDVDFVETRLARIGLKRGAGKNSKDFTVYKTQRPAYTVTTTFRIVNVAWCKFIVGEFGCMHTNGRAVARGLSVEQVAVDAWKREFMCDPPTAAQIRANEIVENGADSDAADSDSDNSNNVPPLGTPSMGRKSEVADQDNNNNNNNNNKWFWRWAWRLRRAHALWLLAGLAEADGHSGGDDDKNSNCVYTSSVVFRDQVTHLALHAGRTTKYRRVHKKGDVCGKTQGTGKPIVAQHDHWAVCFAVPLRGANPTLYRTDIVPVPGYSAGSWCVTMPRTGNIVVRRRHPDSGRSYRPVIIGNCLVKAAKSLGVVFCGRSDDSVTLQVCGVPQTWEVLQTIEFNSTRKRMSVIVRSPKGRLLILCKGADMVIYDRLKKTDGAKVAAQMQTQDLITQYAAEGLRTLVLAKAEIDEYDFRAWHKRYHDASTSLQDRAGKMMMVAEEIETDLELVGTTAIEDKLQRGVPQTIELLSKAGIKIWVLTGDKQETAINIGFACSLLHDQMGIFIFDECNKSNVFTVMQCYVKDAQDSEEQDLGLVIQGDMLEAVLGAKNRREPEVFLSLATHCRAVICCRVSPLQKAQIVRLVRDNIDTVTLAIGDGANDVSMIQAAHVGVGISGLEGLQAARASDFSIAQFRFLQRLLLVHGRYAYRRVSKVTLFSFYKNILLYLTQFWFASMNLWTGQSLYDPWALSLWNMSFSAFPIIFLGVLDRDVEPHMLLKTTMFPELYQDGLRSLIFNTLTFWAYQTNALLQSVAIYILCAYSWDFMMNSSGMSFGLPGAGITTYTCCVFLATAKVGLEIQSWTIPNVISLLYSVVSWYLFLAVYGYMFGWIKFSDFALWYGMPMAVLSQPVYFFTVILVTTVCVTREIAWKLWRHYFQQKLVHIVQEQGQIISRVSGKEFTRKDVIRLNGDLLPKFDALRPYDPVKGSGDADAIGEADVNMNVITSVSMKALGDAKEALLGSNSRFKPPKQSKKGKRDQRAPHSNHPAFAKPGQLNVRNVVMDVDELL